ncbi:hypothetical protein NE237_025675 [Protea cynaroides]|uniref:Copine C-terminal domain-containing protein n=1 Tax=Protea cynaroides TaxID=273540 RepID=A0A9Q0JZS3_9MAGN|nr:hypothetical protein NE237_025675 [Protea cynaroides]
MFSFRSDHTPCQGFEEVLTCYKKIAKKCICGVGPTCYATIIEAAIDMVDKSGGQHYVLVIIADDWIKRRVEIESIVNASGYAHSIVYLGVGDGPWDKMKGIADKIHGRNFDNFQNPSEKVAAFSLVSTMKIPMHYKASKEYGFLGQGSRSRKVNLIAPSFMQ